MNRLSRILVELALEEDLDGLGDLTSRHFVDVRHRSRGQILSRESCVISGTGVARQVCAAVGDGDLAFTSVIPDGAPAQKGDLVATIEGPTRLVLQAERTVLNFMQRLSGVATVTRTYAAAIAHTRARLLDTRKTTPGWRELEKAAVLHGGGTNHRIGLYEDPVDLTQRIGEVLAAHPGLKIEFEADRLDQVEVFLGLDGIAVILLDNMPNEQLREAVALRDRISPQTLLEASGGVNLQTIAGIAETGVDFISVGALTHSVRAIDLGLDLEAL